MHRESRDFAHRLSGCQWLKFASEIRSLWYPFAVRVPFWIPLAFAVLVIAFGLYRIRLATKKEPAPAEGDVKRSVMGGGFYKMSPRTHLLIGIIYLMLGGALIATAFGWNPFGNALGPSTETPTKDKAPTKSGIPIDTIPKK